jgi:hypothetical protein
MGLAGWFRRPSDDLLELEITAAVRTRLRNCGGIAVLELRCHEDTWAFIREWMEQWRSKERGPWWRPEHEERVVEQDQHMRTVRLSGPQAAELLERMAGIADVGGGIVRIPRRWRRLRTASDEAIANRVYLAIARVVDHVDAEAPGGKPVPTVVLDDRTTAGESEPPTA